MCSGQVGRLYAKVAMAWRSLLLFSSSPPLAFSLLLLLLAILLRSFLYRYVSKGSRPGGLQLPPGSFGFPLGIGENVQFAISCFFPTSTIDAPPPFFSSRLSKYGTIFKTHLLGCPIVISMDPDFNKLLLTNEGRLVQPYYPKFIQKVLGPLVLSQGKRHQQIRELLTSRFNPTAIQALHFIPVQEQARNLLRSWSNMVTLDVQQESRKFIFLYALKTLLSLAPEDPRTMLLQSDYHVISNGFSTIPFDIPGTTFNKALKARKRILSIMSEVVKARRGIIGEDPKDVMDVLIKETHEYGGPLEEKDVVECLYAVVIALFETSSIFLTNVVKLLAENPQVLDELQEEHMYIRRNKKEDEFLFRDDLKQMQLTKLVIKETLRIGGIVQIICRDVIQDIFFKDMVIPKGWKVILNFSMIHQSPIYYKDPLKFDPWRWKETNTNNHNSFMPFSRGARSCIGSFFIEFEAMIFIHYLVTKYRWHKVIEVGGDRDGVSGFLLHNANKGLFIKIDPL